jgi:ribonuclease D
MNPIQYIDTPEQLVKLCEQVKQTTWIAVDTEFLREKTYYPKFCLLQLATPEWVACVDPIAITDLTELFNALYNPKLIKVFHSCRQDLEIFFHLTGKVPGPIFDTQVAAPLLGFQDNPGYAMLVSSLLNINLNKAHTRADWSKRPLTQAEIQYAADDVIYLCDVYQKIKEKLTQLGRSDWLSSDFEELTNPVYYKVEPETAWLKIRGKNKLTSRQLTLVQAISEWRERNAQKEDKPRSWLLRDEIIFDMAKLQPETLGELLAIRGLHEKTVHRHGKELCEIIAKAKVKEPIHLKDKSKSAKKTQQHEAIIDMLMALVRIRAEENLLNPSILASRKDLEDLLFNEEGGDCALLHGWRYTMAGKELIGLLKGELYFGIQSEKLVVIEAEHC